MLASLKKQITLEELLTRLWETRDAETLKLLDERYQKGWRDAVDTLIKWYTPEKREVHAGGRRK